MSIGLSFLAVKNANTIFLDVPSSIFFMHLRCSKFFETKVFSVAKISQDWLI